MKALKLLKIFLFTCIFLSVTTINASTTNDDNKFLRDLIEKFDITTQELENSSSLDENLQQEIKDYILAKLTDNENDKNLLDDKLKDSNIELVNLISSANKLETLKDINLDNFVVSIDTSFENLPICHPYEQPAQSEPIIVKLPVMEEVETPQAIDANDKDIIIVKLKEQDDAKIALEINSKSMSSLVIDAKHQFETLNSSSTKDEINNVILNIKKIVDTSNQLLVESNENAKNISSDYLVQTQELTNNLQESSVAINSYETKSVDVLFNVGANSIKDLLSYADEVRKIEISTRGYHDTLSSNKSVPYGRDILVAIDKNITLTDEFLIDIIYIMTDCVDCLTANELLDAQIKLDETVINVDSIYSVYDQIGIDVVDYEQQALLELKTNSQNASDSKDYVQNNYENTYQSAEFTSELKNMTSDILNRINVIDGYISSSVDTLLNISPNDIVTANNYISSLPGFSSYIADVNDKVAIKQSELEVIAYDIMLANDVLASDELDSLISTSDLLNDASTASVAKNLLDLIKQSKENIDANSTNSNYYYQNISTSNSIVALILIDRMSTTYVRTASTKYLESVEVFDAIVTSALNSLNLKYTQIQSELSSAIESSISVATLIDTNSINEIISNVNENKKNALDVSVLIDQEYELLDDENKITYKQKYTTDKNNLLSEFDSYIDICNSRPFEVIIEANYVNVYDIYSLAKYRYSVAVFSTGIDELQELVDYLNPLYLEANETLSESRVQLQSVAISRQEGVDSKFVTPLQSYIDEIGRYIKEAEDSIAVLSDTSKEEVYDAYLSSKYLRHSYRFENEINDFIDTRNLRRLKFIKSAMENTYNMATFDRYIKIISDIQEKLGTTTVFASEMNDVLFYKADAIHITGLMYETVAAKVDELEKDFIHNEEQAQLRKVHPYIVKNYKMPLNHMFAPTSTIENFPNENINYGQNYTFEASYHNPEEHSPIYSLDNDCSNGNMYKDGECIREYGDMPKSIYEFEHTNSNFDEMLKFYRGGSDTNVSVSNENSELQWPVSYAIEETVKIARAQVTSGVCPHWYFPNENRFEGNNIPIKWTFKEEHNVVGYRYAKDAYYTKGSSKLKTKKAKTNMIYTTWKTTNCQIQMTVLSARIDRVKNEKDRLAAIHKGKKPKYVIPHNGKNTMDLMIDVDNKCYTHHYAHEDIKRVAFMNLSLNHRYSYGTAVQFFFSNKCHIDKSGKDRKNENKKEFENMLFEGRTSSDDWIHR